MCCIHLVYIYTCVRRGGGGGVSVHIWLPCPWLSHLNACVIISWPRIRTLTRRETGYVYMYVHVYLHKLVTSIYVEDFV